MKELKKALKDVELDLQKGRLYLDKDVLFDNLKNEILKLIQEYKKQVTKDAGEWEGY